MRGNGKSMLAGLAMAAAASHALIGPYEMADSYTPARLKVNRPAKEKKRAKNKAARKARRIARKS